MNRLKKEIRKKGVKLESDFPFLPFNGIETIKVDSENATISEYHVSAGWIVSKILPNLELLTIMEDAVF